MCVGEMSIFIAIVVNCVSTFNECMPFDECVSFDECLFEDECVSECLSFDECVVLCTKHKN